LRLTFYILHSIFFIYPRPLLFHASDKTTNGEKRRVIHIEFSKSPLPSPLQWSERIDLA